MFNPSRSFVSVVDGHVYVEQNKVDFKGADVSLDKVCDLESILADSQNVKVPLFQNLGDNCELKVFVVGNNHREFPFWNHLRLDEWLLNQLLKIGDWFSSLPQVSESLHNLPLFLELFLLLRHSLDDLQVFGFEFCYSCELTGEDGALSKN